MQKVLLTLIFSFALYGANAQTIKLRSGIEYRYVKKGTGKQTAQKGDFINMILKSTCSGQVIFDSKSVNKNGSNAPVNFPVGKPTYNGDVNEVLNLLHQGDSVVVKIPQDSFYRMMPQAQRKGVTPGEPVVYTIGVYAVYTAAQLNKMQEDYKKALAANAKQQALFKKQQQEQIALQKKQAALDKKQDDEINAYFKANNITGTKKLPSGVYVQVEKDGEGELIKQGYEVNYNNEKFLLSGKKIDSNTDTALHSVMVNKASIGQRQLIQGMEEGLQSFKKGGKGKIFIPSKYAYGSNKFGIRANDTIPANSIIRTDIEILDVVDVIAAAKQQIVKEDSTIQAYLKANNLTGIKTNSGMYCVITQEGSGASPVKGDDVSMNYTGMFLDGSKFDSNVDSAFGHVTPYNFPLGMNRVIAGWDEGITYLKKGTKAKFLLPSRTAYGKYGQGKIPADAILQFDVELVDFKKPEAPKKVEAPKK
jgi:FKBP-type peptidyl-prolyl cis-trans isomerase FkpA